MSDIFREVDEEVRREQYAKLWKNYGPFVIGLAVAIVLFVAGYQGWQYWQQSEREAASRSYAAAMAQVEDGSIEAALSQLADVAEETGTGYATLAKFERARLLAENGDTVSAVALWDEIAEGSSPGPGWRQLATLFSVMHQFDGGDPGILESKLQPLIEANSPFRFTARELAALLALRQGENARAADYLRANTEDAETPRGARTRASQLLQVIGS